MTGAPGLPAEGAPRPELHLLLQPGQQVEFSVHESDGRLLAADVRTAPSMRACPFVPGCCFQSLRGKEDQLSGFVLLLGPGKLYNTPPDIELTRMCLSSKIVLKSIGLVAAFLESDAHLMCISHGCRR